LAAAAAYSKSLNHLEAASAIPNQPCSISGPLTNLLIAAHLRFTSLQRLRLSVTLAGQVC
jgi:hypothetical protein